MSVVYQHCSDCQNPIRSEHGFRHEPDAVHTVCYIRRLLERIEELEQVEPVIRAKVIKELESYGEHQAVAVLNKPRKE